MEHLDLGQFARDMEPIEGFKRSGPILGLKAKARVGMLL
jgi:hypothetical protein